MAEEVDGISVLLRFFAGAAAAAGVEEEKVVVPAGATVGSLVETLALRGPELARVLAASSFLVEAVSARAEDALADGVTLDVLPPFAGG
ncbi:MoaD/ThiS family protein [Kineococcus sp. GCM10028916]|uniref:MoaD/ThiS family protein n=1 Tax=Kineococcus sp. GCM10028916 TaxID=3273394 RepID=UPI003643AF2B